MPSYSHKSIAQLSTCDYRLQRLFTHVILTYDNTILQGHRPNSEQKMLFLAGRSKIEQDGKHNQSPSKAIDAGPWLPGRGIPWPQVGSETYFKDLAQFYHFAGYVMAVADMMGIPIRWGGDWDRDHNLSDQTFDDLVHFELIDD